MHSLPPEHCDCHQRHVPNTYMLEDNIQYDPRNCSVNHGELCSCHEYCRTRFSILLGALPVCDGTNVGFVQLRPHGLAEAKQV